MAEAVIVRATRMLELTAVEELQGLPGAQGSQVTNDDFNVAAANYSPTTTPPVSRHVSIDETILAMTGSAVTIDLTACPGGTQSNIDGTGKKVQRIFLRNEGNAVMILQQGAADPYLLFGSGNAIQLPAKSGVLVAELDVWYADLLADIAAGVKNLRLTGGSGQPYSLAIWFG
jgi:hypothetical protein